jgi:hypothetical protein
MVSPDLPCGATLPVHNADMEVTQPMVPLVPSSVPTVPAVPAESEGTAEPADTATGGKHRGLPDPMETEWPWDTLRAEQEGREGTFTEVMRHQYRWDEEAFTRLEAAMRAGCEALQEQATIQRWVGEGFWCWTAVIPELTEHPRFVTPEATYLRQCLARLRDLGSWFFNGTSPYGSDHVWEPVQPAMS